jgi:hypothetical protein
MWTKYASMPRVGICEGDGQICFFLGLRLGREYLLEREGETYKSYYLHESPKGEENPEKHLDGFAAKVLALELMLLPMRGL